VKDWQRVRIIAGLSLALTSCACAMPPNTTPVRTPDPHTGSALHPQSCAGNTPKEVRVRLPLIEGKDIRFTRYSTEQGLSHGRVDHMLQDAQGFLWIGTYNGLNRFDGYRFQIYKPEPNNPNSLGGVMIYSLFQDRSGVLWIGVDQALDRFDPVTQKFTHFYSKDNDPGSPSGHVEHITQDSDGMLWLATRNGLDRLDPASMRFTHYRHDPDEPHTLSSNDILFVFGDRMGTLWAATRVGLDAIDRRTGSVIRHYSSPNSPLTPLDRIFEDHSGTLWLSATRNDGITSLDRNTGVFTTYTFAGGLSGAAPMMNCSAILEDRHGMLWLGTNPYGVVKFDRAHGAFTRYMNNPADPTSLSHNNALSLLQDREGGIWVGTGGGGVNRFSSEPSPFTILRNDPGNPNSLDENSVYSIIQDREGILWVGTAQLNRIDRKTGQYKHYRYDPSAPGSIASTGVDAATEDRDGFLWFGTWYGGLNRFDRRTGRFKAYRHDPADPASLSSDHVLSLILDHQGNLWAGTEAGLNRMDMRTGRFTVFRFKGPLDSRMYPVLAEDREGSILMGTFEWGLERLDVRTGEIIAYHDDPQVRGSLSNNRVNALYIDRSGTLWVGTQNGLNRFDRNTGQFTVFNERDGLSNNYVTAILEDTTGNLWIATGNGLSKFDPAAGKFKNYYVDNGLAGNEVAFDGGVAFKSASGEMFFGGLHGVTAFYPERVAESDYVPPIVLTDFRLFNNPVSVGTNSVLQKSIPFTDALTLSHKQNIFSVEFSSLSYANPQRNRYRYRLEGLEDSWNEVGSDQRFVTYTTLPHGHYTFRVQGSSSSGVWNLRGVTLALTILPAWYQSPWFSALYLLSASLLLWAAYQFRVRELRREEEKFREAVETMPALAFVDDSKGDRTFVNRAWLEYTGFTHQQALGIGWQSAIHPDDVHQVQEKWRDSLLTGQFLEYEARIRRGSDGAWRWFQTRARPLRDRRGNIRKWVAVATDIEDRRRAEQLHTEMAHVNRLTTMGELLASISHELRQPIAASTINANTVLQWLDRDPPNLAKARERTNKIIEAGDMASQIIDRLRALYKKAPTQRELIAVNDIIGDITGMLRSQATRQGVSLRTDLAADLPPVMADRVQIQQVLMNLMLNGIEAMSKTGGELTVKSQLGEGGQLEITVRDTGPGLPPGRSEQIFDAFFTTKTQGSGMGLAISKSIIESHGGRIWVRNGAEQGATFHFTLPPAPMAAEMPTVRT
jgi:PAS domain S-box-containing protein